jgi:hypothetical protein
MQYPPEGNIQKETHHGQGDMVGVNMWEITIKQNNNGDDDTNG